MPIAHLPANFFKGTPSPIFIFKSHALAGRPVLTDLAKEKGVVDFAWLTKDEIRELVAQGSKEDQRWWKVVKGILNDM